MAVPYHGKTAIPWFQIAAGAWTAFTSPRSWTVTLTAATADATGMGATTGRINLAGIITGTASVECVYDGTKYVELDESDNDVYSAGATGIGLELLRDLTNVSLGYKGGVQCTGVNVGVATDSTPIITYNFIFTGTITDVVTQGT